VNWASGIDPKTWRPIETPNLDYRKQRGRDPPGAARRAQLAVDVVQPEDRLVYIPVNEIPFFFRSIPNSSTRPARWNVGYDLAVADAFPREMVSGHLLAWDPIAQRRSGARSTSPRGTAAR
jgi:hypothetical protein